MFRSEEILELFEDAQEDYAPAVARAAVREGLSVHAATRQAGIKTPQRKAYNRAFTTVALHEQIRQRILRGERPKTGGRGRPPTRWWRVADQLGVDIGQPKTGATP